MATRRATSPIGQAHGPPDSAAMSLPSGYMYMYKRNRIQHKSTCVDLGLVGLVH
jgi:hypothetical protein